MNTAFHRGHLYVPQTIFGVEPQAQCVPWTYIGPVGNAWSVLRESEMRQDWQDAMWEVCGGDMAGYGTVCSDALTCAELGA
jgi:hypothetical protein